MARRPQPLDDLTGLDALPATDVEPARPAPADALAAHPDLRLAQAGTEQARRRLDLLRIRDGTRPS